MALISNAEFGRQTDYHFTMASRIFGGKRLPSLDGMRNISKVWGIPLEELLEHQEKGAAHFGPWLHKRVSAIHDERVAAQPPIESIAAVLP